MSLDLHNTVEQNKDFQTVNSETADVKHSLDVPDIHFICKDGFGLCDNRVMLSFWEYLFNCLCKAQNVPGFILCMEKLDENNNYNLKNNLKTFEVCMLFCSEWCFKE